MIMNMDVIKNKIKYAFKDMIKSTIMNVMKN